MKEIQFEDLIGLHKLSGVDLINESIKRDYGNSFEDCETVVFILDNKTYCAAEDPDDGYRSSMKYLVESKSKVKNKFTSCKVLVKKSTEDNSDILEFIDVNTGLIVLEIGTNNTDDYYPYWVGSFYPENMFINK